MPISVHSVVVASKVGFAPNLKGSEARPKQSQAAFAKAQLTKEAAVASFDKGTTTAVLGDMRTFRKLAATVPHKMKHNGFSALNEREKAVARALKLI